MLMGTGSLKSRSLEFGRAPGSLQPNVSKYDDGSAVPGAARRPLPDSLPPIYHVDSHVSQDPTPPPTRTPPLASPNHSLRTTNYGQPHCVAAAL